MPLNQSLLFLLESGRKIDVVSELQDMPTVEVAEFVAGLEDKDRREVFLMLESQQQAYVFSDFDDEMQRWFIEGMSGRELSALMVNMPSDERADLYQNMKVEEQGNLLPYLPKQVRDDVIQLSSYPEDTAGAAMSSDFATVTVKMTVRQAMEQVRRDAPKKETIYYIYVVDEDRKLLGFVSLKDIILAEPDETIGIILHEDVVSVNVREDQEKASNLVIKYDLIALPVVNDENQLIGIITHDDAIDIVSQEQTEDIHKIGGSEAFDEPYMDIPFFQMFRKRAGWLVILFLSEMLTATAMGFFEAEIARAVVLALFVPLIISSGGNSGSQAATLIIRAMALGEVTLSQWWRVMKREVLTGLTLGVLLGLIGFMRVVLWSSFTNLYGPHYVLIGMTVGLSLVGVVAWGTLMGSMLPLILRRLGFDPAASSAPFVATLVDVTGLVIYFSISLAILSGTLL